MKNKFEIDGIELKEGDKIKSHHYPGIWRNRKVLQITTSKIILSDDIKPWELTKKEFEYFNSLGDFRFIRMNKITSNKAGGQLNKRYTLKDLFK